MSRYRYIRPLGQGNSGQSYLAQDTQSDQRVVIKRFFHEQGLEIEREVAFLQLLSHPAIPSYVDAFVEDVDMVPRFHLVTRHVEAQDLTSTNADPWSIAKHAGP